MINIMIFNNSCNVLIFFSVYRKGNSFNILKHFNNKYFQVVALLQLEFAPTVQTVYDMYTICKKS